MDFLGKKIEDFNSILQGGLSKYKPSKILVGFTGGSDSLTLIHLMIESGVPFQPFFCNVGIGIESQWDFIRSYCQKQNLSLIEQQVVYKTYKQMVIQNGFPGPAQHTIMYRNLKEKSIRFINDYFNRDVLVVSGVRISESEKRKINVSKPIQVIDGIKWASPMMNWDEDDKDEYLEDRKIDKSPVSKCFGMSGECLCGAYASKGEKHKLKDCGFNKEAEDIERLENLLFSIGFTWGWDDPVPEGREYAEVMERIFPGWTALKSHTKAVKKLKDKGQQDLFMPMCHKCEVNFKIKQQRA
jgi:3'-phosphoadenosine 5'-phosphosulfate sulfotransferase (PAPS reductase)/FAD synthetase